MSFKKTMTDILNTLPIIKNRKIKSPGVYTSETDTTFVYETNTSDIFNKSTDPLNPRRILENLIPLLISSVKS